MRYAIVGAGALGLTLAVRLTDGGNEVVVYERSPFLGGLAGGFEPVPGVSLERFYHHLFTSDRHAIQLIEEVGLGQDLLWLRPTTATLIDGRIRQLDSPSSLLRFDALSPVARLRMGAVLALLRAMPAPIGLHAVTAERWLRAAIGDEGYRVLWEPLLAGKFGSRAADVAMAWFWARVHDRTARLGYIRGGFDRLYERLAARVSERGGVIRTNVPVTRIASSASGLLVATDDAGGHQETTFDRVVSTLPLSITAPLVPEIEQDLRAQFPPPAALSAQCLLLGLDRSLVPAYWVNMNDAGFPFIAAVEHTRLVDTDYGSPTIVYLGRYCPPDDPLVGADADRLLDAWTPGIERLRAGFDRSWVQHAWAFSAPFAQPVVDTRFRERIPPFETPLDGFFMANMFQVYPHDRGQNQSIRLAEQLNRVLDGRR